MKRYLPFIILIKMKKLLSLIIISLTTTSAFSQYAINRSANYTSYYDFIEKYFNQINYQRSGEEGQLDSRILKTFKLWGPNLHPSGDFSVAASAITNYANNFSVQNSSYNPNWTNLGSSVTSSTTSGVGQIHRIAFDPNYDGIINQTIYAGSGFGGLWKSNDDGLNWMPLNTDTQLPKTSVSGIAIDPTNSNNIYISTGFADGGNGLQFGANVTFPNPISTIGVYKSKDGGTTWKPINNGLLSNFALSGIIRDMRINPINPDEIVLASSAGVIKTSNATALTPTWNVEFTGGAILDQQFRGIEYKPSDPSIIYASGKDIYKYDGATWSSMTGSSTGLDLNNIPNSPNFDVARINIAVTPADPDMLYAYIYGTVQNNYDQALIYVYKNNIWSKIFDSGINTGSTSGKYTIGWLSIAVSPINANEIYFGGITVRGTVDYTDLTNYPILNIGGNVGAGIHADVHELKFQPITNNSGLFAGTHGGVSFLPVPSDPTPINRWNRRYNGLLVSLIWSFDNSNIDHRKAIGLQDLGSSKLDPVTNIWSNYTGGDGFTARIDDENPNDIYWTTNGYNGRSHFDGTQDIYGQYLPIDYVSSASAFVPSIHPIVNHPETGELWFGYSELYKRLVREIGIGSNPANIWSDESNLYLISGHAATWQRQINSLVIAESNPEFIYMATIGVDVGAGSASTPLNPLLLRSKNGGCNGNQTTTCFTNITTNLPFIYQTSGTTDVPIITDIAVNPSNENELWITFAGYDPTIKVWHSTNAGDNWNNFDPNGLLPNLGVNAIVYQDGTDDILYLGTDVGVYVKNGSSNDWEKYGDFPNVRVSEMKISPCNGKLDVASYGRGLWEGDLLPSSDALTGGRVINGVEVWSGIKSVKSNLIIASGSKLTVMGALNMPKNGKIIVENGGQLIVDGGTISNQCNQLWKGIEVEGDINTSQSDPNLKHGELEIRNNSLIENASEAVTLYLKKDDGSARPQTAGGVITAINSTFKNNLSGITFLPYQNHVPGSPSSKLHDISTIVKCDFIWDGTGSMTTMGFTPSTHLKLQGVHGIEIKGNDFKSDAALYPIFSERGIGIAVIDADCKIDATCISTTVPCPIGQSDGNLFEDLQVGVDIMGVSSITRTLVKKNTFTNNRYGVLMSSSKYTSILENTFNLPTSTEPLSTGTDAIGVFAVASSGFNIEENNFTTIGTATGPSNYGVVVSQSDADGGLIYKNKYDNTIVGNLLSQDNPMLKLDCNDHLGGAQHNYDWAITSGTLMDQGDCNPSPSFTPAKNSFISGCSSTENIYSNGSSMIYSSIGIDAPTCSSGSIFINSCPPGGNVNTCISNITNPRSPTQIQLKMGLIKTEINVLENTIDGGNKANLINIINTAANGIVKNELMAASPYLSDEVLKTYLEKSITPPPGHIKEIAIANSPVTSEIISILNHLSLPKGIQNEIDAAQIGISERALLENDITQLKSEYLQLKNEYIRQCLDLHQIGDVKNQLYSDNTCDDKAILLQLVINDDIQEASNLITDLRNDSYLLKLDNPNCDQADKIDKICDYFDQVKNGIVQNGNFDELDATQEQVMRDLSASNKAISVTAENALKVFLNENTTKYAEPINLGPMLRTTQPETMKTVDTALDFYQLTNYPNPFNNSTIIEVITPENSGGKIVINNILGKQLRVYELHGNKNKIEVNTTNFTPGIYFYSLWVNSEYITVKKMEKTN